MNGKLYMLKIETKPTQTRPSSQLLKLHTRDSIRILLAFNGINPSKMYVCEVIIRDEI